MCNFEKPVKGRISSVESLGARDGTGLRYVIFMQGCPLRCIYCHNPETWNFVDGTETDSETLVDKIKRYKPYFGKNKNSGGVTLSGGEPLSQPEFCADLLRRLKDENIHTAIDTSGNVPLNSVKEVLDLCDLVLLDIKFTTQDLYKKYTGGSLSAVLEILDYLEKINKPVIIRQVIVSGINDNEKDIDALNKLIEGKKCVQKIELLPFSSHCKTKYEKMSIPFPCKDIEDTSPQKIEELYKILR